MIRYRHLNLRTVVRSIQRTDPRWLRDARERARLLRILGGYAEAYTDEAGIRHPLPPFWTRIKQVYMAAQYNKCIYCETRLEGGPRGKVAWDLEHFRPKSAVHAWPRRNQRLRYDFSTGADSAAGYFLLAYHPYNYAASCKICNSALKRDHFPVAADRVTDSRTLSQYAAEQPFLVYPFGPAGSEEDPEELIAFDGAQAIPRHAPDTELSRWQRGRVLIDFFDLNRDGLLADRANWLLDAVWPNFRHAERQDPDGIRRLRRIRSDAAPFANCARCFLRLCETDRRAAVAKIPVLENIVTTEFGP